MTTVPNRAAKARPKAAPEFLSEDLKNAKVIRANKIEDNQMVHIAPNEELSVDTLPEGELSLPLEFWIENKSALLARGGTQAVQLAGAEQAEDLAEHLADVDMVVLTFVNFVDGRNYSDAHKLRTRYAFKGEIRAVGDVNFDQIGFLARVGADAFELGDDEDHEYGLKAFTEFSEVYQPAADGQPLIFSRRRG